MLLAHISFDHFTPFVAIWTAVSVCLPIVSPVVATTSAFMFMADKVAKRKLAKKPESKFWKKADVVLQGGGGKLGTLVKILDVISLNRDRRPGEAIYHPQDGQ